MAELNVTKKSVGTLLSEMQRRKFVIPEYQRPYRWDREKCETLWQDLTEFFAELRPHENPDLEYYLGTIVTCQSDDGIRSKEPQVIDGQQRLTSLLLLLRAFYKMLEDMSDKDQQVVGLRNQIAPCIWDVDKISGQVLDRSRVHIESRVATATDNEALRRILETGAPNEKDVDLYSSNYRLLLGLCRDFAQKSPKEWKALCVTILHNCIILPIECENFDTALTIFSTLNDRGMPLSDSDIFKAQLYRRCSTPDEKRQFTQEWKELIETVETAGITVDALFRYYTHVIRARKKETGKEIGLRKFYAGEDRKFAIFSDPNTMAELAELAERWRALNTWEEADWLDVEAKKWLHCLAYYPNEYWRYVVSVWFFRPGDKETRDREFSQLLRLLVAWLYGRFVLEPTVNAIKDSCFHFMNSILEGQPLKSPQPLPPELDAQLALAHDSKVARGLLLLHAYLNPKQKEDLPWEFDIEHIFPRRWQVANYRGWSFDEARESLERFGNKVICEKKVNIKAGNDYFGQKKKKYLNSKIADVLALAEYPADDWVKTDIDSRDQQFVNDLMDFFRSAHLPAS